MAQYTHNSQAGICIMLGTSHTRYKKEVSVWSSLAACGKTNLLVLDKTEGYNNTAEKSLIDNDQNCYDKVTFWPLEIL